MTLEYCRQCGNQLIETTTPTGKYNRITGDPLYITQHKCPKIQPRHWWKLDIYHDEHRAYFINCVAKDDKAISAFYNEDRINNPIDPG